MPLYCWLRNRTSTSQLQENNVPSPHLFQDRYSCYLRVIKLESVLLFFFLNSCNESYPNVGQRGSTKGNVYRNAEESCHGVVQEWEEKNIRKEVFVQCCERKGNGLLLPFDGIKLRFLFLNLEVSHFHPEIFLIGGGGLPAPWFRQHKENLPVNTGHILS